MISKTNSTVGSFSARTETQEPRNGTEDLTTASISAAATMRVLEHYVHYNVALSKCGSRTWTRPATPAATSATPQPVHLILTLVVDESRVNDLHKHIRAVGTRRCRDACAEPQFEFHGYDLFGGNGPFASMSPERVQIYGEVLDFYGEVLDCIASVDARVIVRGVHKPALAARYANPFHPHDIALMFTIESVERLAREHDRRVLLVADEAREIEDGALRDLANYQQMGTTWEWNTAQIDHVVDTIHFVRSETNPAIQLADCATFIAVRQRKIESGVVAPNAAVTDLWRSRIVPHVHLDSIWHPTP